MFIKVTSMTGEAGYVNLNQVVFVDKASNILRTSDGNTIRITGEALEDVLNEIGYGYDEEDQNIMIDGFCLAVGLFTVIISRKHYIRAFRDEP